MQLSCLVIFYFVFVSFVTCQISITDKARLLGYLWADGEYIQATSQWTFSTKEVEVALKMESLLQSMGASYMKNFADKRSRFSFLLSHPDLTPTLGLGASLVTEPFDNNWGISFAASLIESDGTRQGKIIDHVESDRVHAALELFERLGFGTEFVDVYDSAYAEGWILPGNFEMLHDWPFASWDPVPGGKPGSNSSIKADHNQEVEIHFEFSYGFGKRDEGAILAEDNLREALARLTGESIFRFAVKDIDSRATVSQMVYSRDSVRAVEAQGVKVVVLVQSFDGDLPNYPIEVALDAANAAAEDWLATKVLPGVAVESATIVPASNNEPNVLPPRLGYLGWVAIVALFVVIGALLIWGLVVIVRKLRGSSREPKLRLASDVDPSVELTPTFASKGSLGKSTEYVNLRTSRGESISGLRSSMDKAVNTIRKKFNSLFPPQYAAVPNQETEPLAQSDSPREKYGDV